MKKLLFIAIIILAYVSAQASDWVKVTSDQPAQADISLISSQISQSTVHFTLDGFWKEVVETDRGTAWVLSLDNDAQLLVKGAPDLPIFSASLVVPDKAKMKVNIVSSKYVEFNNVLMAPSKGNLTRNIDPATIPYYFGAEYDNNAFYPGDVATINKPYIIRDVRGQAVHFQPFQYNPVTGVLRVYYDVTIEVVEDGVSSVNVLDRAGFPEKINDEFHNIYQNHFLNFNALASRYDPLDDHGNMLIISYGDFMDEMEPFVAWKTMEGIPVEMVDVADIGNSSAIKQYIADYYNNNGLTFVLLVGDAQQVPASYASGDSDNDYSYVVGNDHYPDLFVGRFSAQTGEQVTTQVQRSVDYEKTPYMEETDWYTHCLGVASSQGPGDDNEYDYEHIRNIQNNKLIPFTYDYAYEYFDGSQGGNDDPGNPSPADVAVGINEGATIINYTGHGSTTSWGTSGFSNTNVNQLTNNGKLPFILSVACVNGNFVNNTCFAEAWLRAENNGEPTGAVATLMSTINQSWNPPMRGQDDMIDVLVGADENNQKTTFGGLTMNGCMGMNDAYGSEGDEMTDTWTIFGDPSLLVRTAVPGDLVVTHPDAIMLGMNTMTVTCDVDGAIVALSFEGNLLGSAFVEDGSATINFDPLENVGTLDVVVTAFNYRPYISTIEVVPAEGPYIVYVAHQVNDASGNGLIDYNEDISFGFTIGNVGVEDANVDVELSVDSDYITFTDSTENFGTVPAGEEVSLDDVFAFEVADNTPDMTVLNFTMTATTPDREVFTSDFTDIVYAPALDIEFTGIDDSEGGNGNGRLDAGETALLMYRALNNGHSLSPSAIFSLASSSEYITVNTGNVELGTIDSAGYAEAAFEIVTSEDAPIGVLADFSADVSAGAYTAHSSAMLPIGLVVEDFETGDFTKFDWTFSGAADWEIIEGENVYEGAYSAKSGTITDNQASALELVVDVSMNDTISFWMKVSSESGYDYLKFYIDDSEKGSWSGEEGWSLEKVAITEGEHTLKWAYEKDGSVSNGDDCAWLDYIILPGSAAAPLYADFYSDIQEVYDNPEVHFFNNSGGDITEYYWEFEGGDPATSTEENPVVNYNAPGVYDVTLTISDGENESTIVKEDYITAHEWVGVPEVILDESSVKAYPNPFDSKVNISMALNQTSHVTVDIFDITGRRVKTLADEELNAGTHTFTWNAISVEPGLYFYCIRTAGKTITKKLVLSR